jgi:small GTP-binding protein
MAAPAKVKVKTVLLGDSGVGKTSIAVRLAKDEFNDRAQPTVGAAFFTFMVDGPSGETIQFEMWDTAGQERYRSLAPMYYRGAEVVVLVFALNDRQSFDAGLKWLQDVRSSGLGSTCTLVLVGNKVDLEEERQVAREMAESFAAEQVRQRCHMLGRRSHANTTCARWQGMMYIETSARTAQNVRQVMQMVAQRLPEGVGVRDGDEAERRAARRTVRMNDAANEPKKGCC